MCAAEFAERPLFTLYLDYDQVIRQHGLVLVQLGRSPSTVMARSITCDSKENTPAKLAGQLRCAALVRSM